MVTDLRIETAHGLVDAVTHAAQVSQGAELWWRGHSCADWRLLPGAFRNGRDRFYESNVLRRFVRKARTRRTDCPAEGDWPRWLFLAQHYGLPTRLLDWTESPLIGLYFAINEAKEEDGALWCLQPVALNHLLLDRRVLLGPGSSVKHEGLLGTGLDHGDGTFETIRLFEEAFQEHVPPTDGVFAVMPDEADARMQLQLSMFTIHGSVTPIDSTSDTAAIRFLVPHEAKERLRFELYEFGIRESNIFPDLEHLANEIQAMDFSVY